MHCCADAPQRTLQFGAGVSRQLECPKGMVGRVIGKGGETIKALQKQFQCNIQIDQATDPMSITISGQPHTVEPAAGVCIRSLLCPCAAQE